ncbi:MAG: winged helix-turn-helix domain-containing protein [Pseudomonadota bacterium]
MSKRDLNSGFRLRQWLVQPSLGRVSAGGIEHHVEPKVMNVLVYLAESGGEVVSRDAIVERVWEGRPVSDDGLSRCIKELRKVLGDDARTPSFIETVPKRGYRLLPNVELSTPDSRTDGAHRSWSARATAAVAVVLAVVLVAVWFSRDVPEPAEQAGKDRPTLAVLPLVSRSAIPEDSFIADGLHDDLLTQLSRIEAWDVISRTSVERFRDSGESIPEIASQLNASLILEGGVQRNGAQVRINVQLIDASGDTHLWAKTYDRELTVQNLFDVQSDIVESIVGELTASLDARQSAAEAAPTVSFEAYNEYVKGRRLARTESVVSLKAAADHFEAAIGIDPDYAEAHAALADAYLSLGIYFYGGMQWDEAAAAAEPLIGRAIGLNPDLAHAYVANALLQILLDDMTAAEEAIETALELQPSYPRAHRVFANIHWRQQQSDRAIELGEHASSLDPLSGVIQLELGRYYEATGSYDAAMENYLTAADVLPDNALARLYIGALKYLVYGEVAESLVWYTRAAELDPESPSMQATPAMAFMDVDDLDRAGDHVRRGMALDPNVFWPRFTSMMLHLRRGEREAAWQDAEALRAIVPNQYDALRVLRDRDLAAGNPATALFRYAEVYPELTEPREPRVDAQNYRSAVDLALVYSVMGERQKAQQLTAAALELMQDLSREGIFGYWLTDVAALSIRGEHDRALNRLEEAVEDGVRILLSYHLDIDPNFAALREQPRFPALREKVGLLVRAEAEKAESLRALRAGNQD